MRKSVIRISFRFTLLVMLVMTTQVAMAQMPVIDSTIVNQNPCELESGELVVFASGGMGTLMYSIDNGVNFQTSNIFSNLPSDDYLILVIDDVSASISTSVQIPRQIAPPEPTIDCPPPLDIECGDINNIAIVEDWLSQAIALDFMSDSLESTVDETIDFSSLSICGASMNISISAEDICETEARCFTSITVIDTEMPRIICPQDTIVDISDSQWAENTERWLEGIISSDNCLINPSPTNDLDLGEILQNCDDMFVMPVEFVVTDECSNSTMCMTNLTVNNELNPVVFCDTPLDFVCNTDHEELFDELLIRFEDLFAFDEDITVEDDLDSEAVIGLQCGDSVELSFTVTDACERSIQCTAEIIIVDSEIPTLDFCPDNITVDVITDVIITQNEIEQWMSSVLATDNCSAVNYDSDLDPNVFDDLCNQRDPLVIQFFASDNCGNINDECMSTLRINEQINTINCPPTLEIECGADGNMAEVDLWLGTATATLNGIDVGGIENNFDNNLPSGGCILATEITFSIRNLCDDVQECTSNITLTDTEAPSITCPLPLAILASDTDRQEQIDAWLETLVTTDNCSDVQETIPAIDVSMLDCGDIEVIEIQAADDCGNRTSCSTEVMITEEQDAAVTCPEQLRITCNGNNATEILTELEAVVQENLPVELFHDFDPSRLSRDCEEQEIGITFAGTGICSTDLFCNTVVLIRPRGEIYIPNALNPRAEDIANRYFTVYGDDIGHQVNSLGVYDRWGNLIYESNTMIINDTESGWDGSGFSTGTYAYLLSVTNPEGEEETINGSITIVD